MTGDHLVDGEIVGYRDALETPFIAQDGGQQPLIGMGGHAVDLVIGGHDGADIGFLDDLLERREEIFAQGALRHFGRPDIGAVFRLAVAGHVLQGGEHLVLGQRQGLALEADHRRLADHAAQVRIFAIGFLDTAPARFAGDIDDRRQSEIGTTCAHFTGGHGEDLLGHVGIEAGSETNGLREGGRVLGDVAVERFLMHDHRNAEAGLFDRPLLHGVDMGGGLEGITVAHGAGITGPGRRRQALLVGGTRHHAEAVRPDLRCLGRIELAVGVLDIALLLPDAFHLGDFFLQRHAAEQVGDARVDA